MKYSDAFLFGSTNIGLLEGPVDQVSGSAIVAATSAKARLFNDAKDTVLSAIEAASQTEISVESPGLYQVGVDSVVIWLDDGTWHEGGVVTASDTDAGTITITTALASGAMQGNRVCCVIGDAIGNAIPWESDMTFYQGAATPVAGNFDYGWRATFPAGLSAFGLDIGVVARIELYLNASAGLEVTQVMKRRVVGGV